MSPSTAMNRKPLVRRSLVVSLVFAAIAFSSLVPQAFARSSTGSGSPGQASFNATVQGSHTIWSLNPLSATPYLTHAVTYVCRSPRTSGDQMFTATYSVSKWNGSSWSALPSTAPLKVKIPAGSACGSLPSFRWSQAFTSGGYFYVAAVFAWYDAYGTWLGSYTVRFEAQGDYSCATDLPCQSGPGWIYLR